MKHILRKLLLAAGMVFMLASCSQITSEKSSEDEKCTVKIFAAADSSRAANPSATIADFDSFTLKGTKSDESEQTLGLWTLAENKTAYQNLAAAEIPLSVGEWSFTLIGTKGGSVWKGTTSKTIENGPNSLAFKLRLSSIAGKSEGNGSLSINMTVPNVVASAKATLYAMNASGKSGSVVKEEKTLTVEACALTYTKTDIPHGTYIAVFALYDNASTKLGIYREYVNIAADCESSSTVTVTSVENFTITYNVNNEALGETVTVSGKGSWSHYEDPYTFPTPVDPTGSYTFSGWNTKADGSGTTITSTEGQSGNLTLYAQWEAVPDETVGTVSVTIESVTSDIPELTITLDGNTFYAPEGYANYFWLMEGAAAVTKNSSDNFCTVNLNNWKYNPGFHRCMLIVTDENGKLWSVTAVLFVESEEA